MNTPHELPECLLELTPNHTAIYHIPAGEYTSVQVGQLFQRCSQYLRDFLGNDLAPRYPITLLLASPIYHSFHSESI